MKILVTGAGGLLGGRIINFLSQKGHNIVAVSRSYPGATAWKENVRIVNIDLNQSTDLQQYLKDVELVIHAAGINAVDSIANPANALYFNGVVTAKLLNESINCSVHHFIYLSTTHVYSNRFSGVITENSPATNLHPYATSHKAGEDVVLFANEQKKIQGNVLRLSNAFGYPINDNANCWMLLVNDLCRQAISNGTLHLNSSGKQFRNFIAIAEVCRLLGFIIEFQSQSSKCSLMNVASKNTISIMDMAKLVQMRAELHLGYHIPLHHHGNTMNYINQPFDMHTISLDMLNYQISNDLTTEIDVLLQYCADKFRK